MIKLIVADSDGTLAEDGACSLNPELLELILQLKEQGIYFVAASGRNVSSMERIFEPIRDKIFYIAGNGGYVGCYGRQLFITEYRKELAADVIRDMRGAGFDLMIDGPSTRIPETGNFWTGC